MEPNNTITNLFVSERGQLVLRRDTELQVFGIMQRNGMLNFLTGQGRL